MTQLDRKTFEKRKITQLPHQWERHQWVRTLEKQYGVTQIVLGVPFKIPMNAKHLYWDARESYINGNYLSTVIVIGSTIEATIIGKIDPMLFNTIQKNTIHLTLHDLIELAR